MRLCVRAGDRFACWPVCDGSFNLACRNAFTHTLVARVRACVNQMACTFIVFLYFIRMVIYALGSGALSNTTYLPLCLSHSLCSNPNVRQMQRSISCFVFGTGEFRMDTFPAKAPNPFAIGWFVKLRTTRRISTDTITTSRSQMFAVPLCHTVLVRVKCQGDVNNQIN